MKFFRKYVNFLIFGLFAIWLFWWINLNPAPDGYQNEYLHVGNAYDLWGYVVDGDLYNVRLAAYTGYWPFGFYIVPWPLMVVSGMTRSALILSNLFHLGVLLIGATLLAKRFGRPLLFALLCLCPAVFGGLTRFEPNLANVAWMALGLGCLMSSRGFMNRRMSVLWGAALGIGLMMDRLTLAFFLIPPALPYLKGLSGHARRNALYGALTALLITGAYYREFFKYHSEEIFSQAATGEIDSAGFVDAAGGPLYYLLGILDSQAGPFIGSLMTVGLFVALWRFVRKPSRDELVLLLACLPGLLFFSILEKKQLYYTFPALVPLAVWAAGFGRYSMFGGALGVLGWLSLGVGFGSLGGPWLPKEWTAPRHVLAKPPSNLPWPFEELTTQVAAEGDDILVFSESHAYFEGFVALNIRELFPRRKIRSVVLDPQGSNEFIKDAEYFVWIRSDIDAWAKKYLVDCKSDVDIDIEWGEMDLNSWPNQRAVKCELDADHYDTNQLPTIWRTLSAAKDEFVLIQAIPIGEETAILFKRD